MPLLRERSKIPRKKAVSEDVLNTKWTLREKKKLLVALRKLSPDNLEQIRSRFLPHRTEKEIFLFLERMKIKSSRKIIPNTSRPRVPIELWEKMAEELTCHDVDYSFALSEVFEKIANEEEHFPKNIPENPDWKLLYTYMAALMSGDELPEIGQIEAAVLLDLTESLASHIKSLDTAEQQSIMTTKYNFLAARVNADTEEAYIELTKKALDLDPSELSSAQDKKATTATSNEHTASSNASQSSTSSDTLQSAPGPSTSENAPDPIVIAPSTGQTNTPESSKQPLRKDRRPSSRRIHLVGLRTGHLPRGRRRKEAKASPISLSNLQKTALYSINPFSIPIRYLNPKVKVTESGEGVASVA